MASCRAFPAIRAAWHPARVMGGPSFLMGGAASAGIFLPSGEINNDARTSGYMIPMYVRTAQK